MTVAFETYDLYEKASGSKLNRVKSKGLWLGSWRGRLDPPVDLDWSSLKLKVLGVFIGAGDLVEENWRPRVDAVAKVLSSWRSRSLTFRGKALVINALALSRIWYVASLVDMPPRILHELCTLVFNFFWSGKKDLVSRTIVVQSPLFGGFSVVDVKLKVLSLLAQWVKRFASSCSGWVSFMSYWFDWCLSASAMDIFSAPSSFRFGDLPPSYKSLVLAWRELGGAFSVSRSSLVFGAADPLFCVPVSSMTTSPVIFFCFPKGLLTLTASRSLLPRLEFSIGRPHGGLCPSLIWIVRSSTLTGRLLTVFSTLLSVFLLLGCPSPFRFSVVSFGDFVSLVFCLPFGSKCPVMAAVVDVFF